MRALNEIVSAVRLGEPVHYDELSASVVAFDVLLAQLELPDHPKLLAEYFKAAESCPREYVGEANWHEKPDVQAWYRAMHGAGRED